MLNAVVGDVVVCCGDSGMVGALQLGPPRLRVVQSGISAYIVIQGMCAFANFIAWASQSLIKPPPPSRLVLLIRCSIKIPLTIFWWDLHLQIL